MVQIKDLEVRQGNVEIIVDITEKGDVREFQKFGRSGKVCTATAKDETGEVKLTLWNDDVDKVNVGDKIKLTNGYVNEFQGEAQLTAGKFGKMEKVGEGEASAESDSGQTELSDNVAETIGEDVAEDAAVKEAVKEEAPEETTEEQVEEAAEAVEEAAE